MVRMVAGGVLGVLLLVVVVVVQGEQQVRYDGYQLIDVHINSEEQRRQVEGLNLDVWTREGSVGLGSNHILVPPTSIHTQAHAEVLRVLWDLSPRVLIDDVQDLINNQHNNNKSEAAAGWFDAFHTFDEIVTETKRLASQYSTISTFVPSIGTSIQGKVRQRCIL